LRHHKNDEQSKEETKEAHHPLLLAVLADELGCAASSIVDFELNVCDTQPSTVAGASSEFIFSGRLDNLAMSFCALKVRVRHVHYTALPCVREQVLKWSSPTDVEHLLVSYQAERAQATAWQTKRLKSCQRAKRDLL
jgi:hypothetical protein